MITLSDTMNSSSCTMGPHRLCPGMSLWEMKSTTPGMDRASVGSTSSRRAWALVLNTNARISSSVQTETGNPGVNLALLATHLLPLSVRSFGLMGFAALMKEKNVKFTIFEALQFNDGSRDLMVYHECFEMTRGFPIFIFIKAQCSRTKESAITNIT